MKKETVILIIEENHRIIGIAKSFSSAIDFLYDNNWMTPETELYNPFDDTAESDWVCFEKYNLTKEDLKKCGLEIFNDLFDSVFFLDEWEVV